MAPTVLNEESIPPNESVMAERLASILDLDMNDWEIRFGASIRGRSGVMHTFDAILDSRSAEKFATVLFLMEKDENKSETLMMHRVKSNDVSAFASYVLTDHDLDHDQQELKEMCHLQDFKAKSDDLASYRKTSMVSIENQNGAPVVVPPGPNRGGLKASIPKRKNRDRTKIVHEILGSVIYLKKASITQLIYRCNLNYMYAKNLLNDMVKKGMVNLAQHDGIGKRYEITGKGLKAFERLEFHEYI